MSAGSELSPARMAEAIEHARYESMATARWQDLPQSERASRVDLMRRSLERSGLGRLLADLEERVTTTQHLAEAVEERDAELSRRDTAHAAELTRLTTDHAAETTRLTTEHAAQLTRLTTDHAAQLERLTADHDGELARRDTQHAADVEAQAARLATLSDQLEQMRVRADGAETRARRAAETIDAVTSALPPEPPHRATLRPTGG